MAEPIEAQTSKLDRSLWWALGTFHAALLITIAVLLLYLAEGLGSFLSGLSTVAGLALFGALWLSSVWSTRRALRGAVGPGLVLAVPFESLVGRGVIQGGWTGLTFLAFLAIILGVPALVQRPNSGVLVLPLVLSVFGVAAAALAIVIGWLLGLVFALLDLLLLGAARALVD